MTAPTLTSMKFYIVVPEAGINYVTNPIPQWATTKYATVGAGSAIALSDAYSRRGAKCIMATPATGVACGVIYEEVSVTDTHTYTFSVDVLGVAGQAMRIYIADTAHAVKATTTFTATGYWQRISVTLTAAETAATYELYVIRDAVASVAPFYADGFQFEESAAATTFISGYEEGFGYVAREYYWGGTAGASISYRSGLTRHGGRLVDISTYAKVLGVFGLGMGTFDQVMTDMVSGGALYQKHIRKPRNFSLMLNITGANPGALQTKRDALIDMIRPDTTGYDQPMVLRYQGFDASGYEASNPVDIVCVAQTSLIDTPATPVNQRVTLNFTVMDGHLLGAFKEGKDLVEYEELTDADYIVYRDSTGEWKEMGTGLSTSVIPAVTSIVEAPNGDIYIGGIFNSAGGVANTKNIAKWNGSAWVSVTNAWAAGLIHVLCFDTEGNLYIGGDFDNIGDANGDHIVMWDGAALHSLGTGCNGDVNSIVQGADGNIYVGGNFTSAGGVADTAKIARWDGSAFKALATGLNGNVLDMGFAPNGDLYIGGAFTNADGTYGDYICYWNGVSFNRLGTVELNAAVYTICFDSSGALYAGGLFTSAGGDALANYIAKFKNPQWVALQSGVSGNVYDIYAMKDGSLIVVGAFTSVVGLSAGDKIAFYKNGAWQSLDIDLSDVAPSGDADCTFESSNGCLYIGGSFTGTAVTGYLSTSVVNSTGSANVYPVVELVGPGTIQSIINYTTGKYLIFNDLTLLAGERVWIDLDPTNLRIWSNWRTRGNLWRYVNAGSDMAGFHLGQGINNISAFISAGLTAATAVYITWKPKFWSIDGAKFT